MPLTVVGVGPGAPDLMTLRAVRAIEEADVVAYPETGRGSLAARIAASHTAGAKHVSFAIPMTGDGAAEAAYDAAAARLAPHLAAGRRVALLCEGDAMLYGSAASLVERLGPATVVPGVIAASAAAAAAGVSLVRGETAFTILPATAPAAALDAALARPDALALYKVGRHFDTVAARIRSFGRTGTLVVRASQEDETVTPLAEAPAGPKPYFSLILVPAGRPEQAPRTGDVALVVLGPAALPAAERARAALGGGATVHGLARRVPGADVLFVDTAHHLRGLFRAGTAIVAFASSGILVRALGPVVADKGVEPPVVAVAEDGSSVVPLLGAHAGGAAIAETLAAAFSIRAAHTTRSEAVHGIALDDPPEGWVVADPRPFKAVAAGDGASPDPALTFLPPLPDGPTPIRATHHRVADGAAVPTYIARRIALGMGAERGADPAAAVAFVSETLAAANLDPRAVAVVASLDAKADEPALHAVAASLGAPFRVFDAATLAREEPRLATPSEVVRSAVGVAGVAEAAALAAAGPEATLLVPKRVAGQLTAAIALAPAPIVSPPGRARGHLAIVGTGPGDPALRTAELRAALARADSLVGYSLYLDLVEDLRAPHQSRHDFPLGDETPRVRFALERAGEGREVALVSSGDPGIYAMASLAMELLDAGDLSDAARRVDVTVVPGLSAAQLAAARVGAPLGHDFAFVSLSDLLTPWAVIERRLQAVAEADFAVALYNPRSLRRTDQLTRALDILRAHRPPETPVVIAGSVGRPAERIVHTTLATVDPATVDMLATVLVGASTTRRFTRGDGRALVYTPRGYAAGRTG